MWDKIAGNWDLATAKIKGAFADITDDELGQMKASEEEMRARLRVRFADDEEKVEEFMNDIESSFDNAADEAEDVVDRNV